MKRNPKSLVPRFFHCGPGGVHPYHWMCRTCLPSPPPVCFPSVFPFFFIGFGWHQNGIHKEWQPTRHSKELTLMYVASATEELLFLKAIHGMDGIPGVVNCFHVLTPFLPASSFDSAPPHLSISRRSARSLSFSHFIQFLCGDLNQLAAASIA